jgi:hypothetical protein
MYRDEFAIVSPNKYYFKIFFSPIKKSEFQVKIIATKEFKFHAFTRIKEQPW